LRGIAEAAAERKDLEPLLLASGHQGIGIPAAFA